MSLDRIRQHLLGLSILLLASLSAHAQPDYLKAQWAWPTEASTLLTGTFGETRSAHFHAGLDIKTWGREGYEVFASRDGILHRVGASPYGYGRVVYLKHDDGSISLYAHLRDFAPSIRHLVDSLRLQTYPFRFDEMLEQYGLRFRQGDLIAYSGSSGIGPPHLHFELRTPNQEPFNPLLANIPVKDTTPPRISGIAIEPLSTDASVNGRAKITEITPSKGNAFGPVEVSGTIGLAVNASDYADGATNVYAVYKLELEEAGRSLFVSRADSFSYSNTSQMFLDRVYPLLMSTRRGYQRLYRRDGNTLPLYTTDGNEGRLRLSPGRHTLRITATDYFGNSTSAAVTIHATSRKTASPSTVLPSPEYPRPVEYLSYEAMRGIEWTNNGLSLPGATAGTTADICGGAGSSVSSPCRRVVLTAADQIDLRGSDSSLIRLGGKNLGAFYRMYPGVSRTLYNLDRTASADFLERTLYDTLSVSFTASVRGGVRSAALWPTHEPLRSGVRLTWLLEGPEAEEHGWGWYQTDEGGRASWMGGSLDGRRLEATTSRMGTFEIRRDTIPPVVNSPKLIPDHAGRQQVTVRVRDDLSGMNFEATEFRVDGVRGIIEYEPSGAMLIWLHPDHRPRKGSDIEVVVADNAGNRTVYRSKLP